MFQIYLWFKLFQTSFEQFSFQTSLIFIKCEGKGESVTNNLLDSAGNQTLSNQPTNQCKIWQHVVTEVTF